MYNLKERDLMKRKYSSKIFLDIAKEYEINIYYDKEDYYLIVKKSWSFI